MDFCGCKTALLKKVWVQLHPLCTHTYATPVSKPAGCSWLPKATLFLRAVIAMVLKQHTVRRKSNVASQCSISSRSFSSRLKRKMARPNIGLRSTDGFEIFKDLKRGRNLTSITISPVLFCCEIASYLSSMEF